MPVDELWMLSRLLDGLWGKERTSIQLQRSEFTWRWCAKQRILYVPLALKKEMEPNIFLSLFTQKVGVLLLSSESFFEASSEVLPVWGQASTILSSLLLSSLELGIGKQWVAQIRPGLSDQIPEIEKPSNLLPWAEELWEACEALLGCGQGKIQYFKGKVLEASTIPMDRIFDRSSTAMRAEMITAQAHQRYTLYLELITLLEDSLQVLLEALKSLPYEILAQQALPISPAQPHAQCTLLLEPFSYLSSLNQLILDANLEDQNLGMGTPQSTDDEMQEKARQDLDDFWVDLSEDLASTEGDDLLPFHELSQALMGEISPYLQAIIAHLKPIEDPIRSLQRVGLYESGRTIELRALMQAHVRPHQRKKIWQRNALPQRQAQAHLMLVDLSASMRGERLDALLEALALVCLALAMLKVPFALYGFQDELIPILHFSTPKALELNELLPSLIAIYGEVWGNRPDGHNRPQYNDDGPCLAQAVRYVRETQARKRSVWVLSDGLPKGARSGVHELKEVILQIEQVGDVSLFGLGVGSGTEHVEALYPIAQGNVPLQQLAEVMGSLIFRSQRL